MAALLPYLGYIVLFLTLGLYTFGEELIYFAASAMTYGALGLFITLIPLVFDIAMEILTSLDLSTHMMTTWNFIPLEVRQGLAFFRIPEVLSVLIVVGVAKFVFRFVPFMK